MGSKFYRDGWESGEFRAGHREGFAYVEQALQGMDILLRLLHEDADADGQIDDDGAPVERLSERDRDQMLLACQCLQFSCTVTMSEIRDHLMSQPEPEEKADA